MKAKIILLTPVYNDWKNLTKLLRKINTIFSKKIKKKFELVIVDDCSSDRTNFKMLKFKMVKKLTVLSLKYNLGSQRAIAIGIKYLSIFYKHNKNFKTIIMDSDGQDNPKAIPKILSLSYDNSDYSIAINRGQRKEPIWFKIFYEVYCLFIKIFCLKKIRFGNFSLINSKHLKIISKKKELWNAFPPTVSMNIKDIIYQTFDREKRYSGKSKMNFLGLVLHALKVFSVFKNRIFVFSIIYFFISLIFFLIHEQKIIYYSFNTFLILLNLSNIIVSLKNKNGFKQSYGKIKIKTF